MRPRASPPPSPPQGELTGEDAAEAVGREGTGSLLPSRASRPRAQEPGRWRGRASLLVSGNDDPLHWDCGLSMAREEEEEGNSTLRILVATDCHLGYLEKDEVRRFDSFDAFEEICSLAEKNKVDFLLLGGDLFHENKPSCSTLVKAIEILRRYCMNDRPVQFQVVSDQAASLQNRFGQVNYEDPSYNVGLPVFTIHGNHDDPTGADNLSAIDTLSACNFLNYFGKMNLGSTGVGNITVSPILIRKVETSVALYGLGNIRDGRLNRMLHEPHAVNWMQPESRDETPLSDWFNILILHQNRAKGSPNNGISEHLLPRFLDLVIWGHEHECLIDPQEVPGMGFHITQPGSSIATSLINAEAKPKHVLLLEIKGSQYRTTKIPLQSVRPFEYAEVVLEDQVDVDPSDEATIHAHLHKVVSDLIKKSRETAASGSELKLPLVRIKVNYSGILTINPKQFGQKYVGKVANPQDILAFSRSWKRRRTTQGNTENSEELGPDELNDQTIKALIEESNLNMQILPVHELNSALHDFVDGDDKMAFHSCLQQNIEEARKKLTTATEDSINIDEEQTTHGPDQYMKAREKETLSQGRTSSQNLQDCTLSAFEGSRALESDDEPVESAVLEESACDQRAGKKRRTTAPGGGGGSAAAAAAGRRKTDLASFQRAPVKEDDAGASKKGRARVAAGRYGAVIRRR
ncbi:double-strand break repair protein MRE11-like [Phragmites australis]|uniref:double-strand break repair protein MRE11-like n=1 Tax=Phragmites australis TaxID=29695 RepID=UPI002D772E07|nr:double-strand break repair protein MRE11-like [Phragmites australis]